MTIPIPSLSDVMRDLCIKQGYVPKDCTLIGLIILTLVNGGKDPCAGCHMFNCSTDHRRRKEKKEG